MQIPDEVVDEARGRRAPPRGTDAAEALEWDREKDDDQRSRRGVHLSWAERGQEFQVNYANWCRFTGRDAIAVQSKHQL